MATVMATPGLQRSGFCIKSRKCLKGRAAWKGERSQFGPMGVGEGWESGGEGGGRAVRPREPCSTWPNKL